MSWDVTRPSRRLLIRNLPAHSTNQYLHEVFSHYGEVVEAFVPMDPQTRRARGFGFVEFRSLGEAQAVKETVTDVEGSRVTIVFVESKRSGDDEPRNSTYASSGPPRGSGSSLAAPHTAPSGPAHGGGRLQPPPVAPPPPINPNTETYRYNTMAGEFTIDASGRLTRRREYDFEDGQAEMENRSSAGIGGGLLVAAGAVAGMDVDETTIDETMASAEQQNAAAVLFDTQELDQMLKPSEVIDFADI